jgi:protoporphyrinogen oxidase
MQYLGVLCPLLILKKRLTPYYVLNITDKQIPFTAVVETTNLIDPQYVGGYYLVYLPKYLTASSPYWQWDEERIRAEWLRQLCVMFPDFDQNQIVDMVIQRARFVEPLRPLGTNDQIPPPRALVPGLYMSNSAMVYPDLNNGESITLLAQKIVSVVLEDFNALPMSSGIN